MMFDNGKMMKSVKLDFQVKSDKSSVCHSWTYIQYDFKLMILVWLFQDPTPQCAPPLDEVWCREVNDHGKTRLSGWIWWEIVFVYNCHTFGTTPKKSPEYYYSQIQPHHAHRLQMRFDVGKWMNLVKLDFQIESDEKWYFTILVIHSVPLRRSYLSVSVHRSNHP